MTAHRWLKATFTQSSLAKATFSHHRTTSATTRVTPTTGAPPEPMVADRLAAALQAVEQGVTVLCEQGQRIA